MQLADFLTLLVPAGTLVSAKLVPVAGKGSTFHHGVATVHTQLANQLLAIDQTSHNAYFALAAYKQGFYTGTDGRKHLRERVNVDALKSLWIDLDFFEKVQGQKVQVYADARAAVAAVKAFCQHTKMPPPAVVVGTGNGVHVYWPLDDAAPVEEWQRLADALKVAAQDAGLKFDPTCTADACRVLRPIGTHNWKDPQNPKPVSLLYNRAQTWTFTELEGLLAPWLGQARRYTNNAAAAAGNKAAGFASELTGGMQYAGPQGRFDLVVKHCGVARMMADTHGKQCVEPLWMAGLQLLRHCEDGDMWVHPISDGHPGYNADLTNKKWEQRKKNTAGPTLCSTFETHEPAICAKCPHRGFVKTPIMLGYQEVAPLDGLPTGWRVAPDRKGIERLMVDTGNGTKEWVRQMRHVPAHLRATRSITTGKYELSFDVECNGSKPWNICLPGGALGNTRKFNETLADYGMPLKERESKAFGDLMTTWLSQLQAARRVADVTEQLGWLVEKTPEGEKIIGFSCGPTTFYSDGRVRDDVAAANEFASIARYYEPKGGLEQWKKVAAFLSDQNKPAFTALVSAAFGTPLLRFTGLAGGIFSIVSTASGVGKSSALKCSQAVWGSPTHGVNAVDDTPKSVARRLGFLNNLPAYWDELRGRKTVDDFLTLAFTITQGKEKTRLDSSAQLREVATWETMLVVASNESIFEAMARHGGGSDAGLARTFEITVEPFSSDRNRAELSLLFESLNSNYGHAGRVYAQYLACNAQSVSERVEERFKKIATSLGMSAAERFWFAIATIIMVGAELAAELDLMHVDQRALGRYLIANIMRLRSRSVEALTLSQPTEILASYMAAYQDRTLIVDKFPPPRSNHKTYLPEFRCGTPKADKISLHVSQDEGLLRIPRVELERWLQHRELPVYSTLKHFKDNLGAREIRTALGAGTKWQLPPQKIMEFDLQQFGLSIFSRSPTVDPPADSQADAPATP